MSKMPLPLLFHKMIGLTGLAHFEPRTPKQKQKLMFPQNQNTISSHQNGHALGIGTDHVLLGSKLKLRSCLEF